MQCCRMERESASRREGSRLMIDGHSPTTSQLGAFSASLHTLFYNFKSLFYFTFDLSIPNQES
jgi:hypothetical protein